MKVCQAVNKGLMKNLPTYSVAIRTLGKAGSSYLATLQSCVCQTHKPDKIIVYLAEGYEKPKETVGVEQIVYTKKGMVAQRAVSYDEIDSEYVLCLDDDLRFPPDFVERLFAGLAEYDADCISPNTFPNHLEPWKNKIRMALYGTLPHFDKKKAFKVRRSGYYSYNHSPKKDVLPTESFAFAAFLIKKSALKAIHFEEEEWLDAYGYAFGDDELFSNRLYKNGFKALVHYNSGLEHLDAGTSHSQPSTEAFFIRGEQRYLLMYRACLDLKRNNAFDRMYCRLCFWLQQTTNFILQSPFALRSGNLKNMFAVYFSGSISATKKTSQFDNLRKFDDCRTE